MELQKKKKNFYQIELLIIELNLIPNTIFYL